MTGSFLGSNNSQQVPEEFTVTEKNNRSSTINTYTNTISAAINISYPYEKIVD